jgi:hypothetical protein
MPASAPVATEPSVPAPTPAPAPVVAEPVEAELAPAPTPTLETASTPEPVEPSAEAPETPSTEPSFSWQASEYIHHAKGAGWYVVLVLVLIALMAIVYFTKQWLGGAVFAVGAIAIIVYARKAPRTLTYELSDDGITIEKHHYPFSQFRTFAVLPDIAWHTIDLEPTQRFMPRLTILFEDTAFDTIIDHLSAHLPRVDRQPDMVERATRYLRF